MILLKSFRNIFRIPDLVTKLLITFGIIIVYRIGAYIPVIGIDIALVSEGMANLAGSFLRHLDTFSGGALSQATLFSLGIGPYITASIMMQMLTMAVPTLEQLSKEGGYGRAIINQYTKYLSVVLSVFYAVGYSFVLEKAGFVLDPGIGFRFIFVLSLVTGALFVMWLGDQISLFGLGNGSSMIIFAGILSRFPDYLIRTLYSVQIGSLWGVWAILGVLSLLAIAVCIVFLEKATRRIPVQYARRVIGQRVYAGQSTYIPFKLNPTGVMPAILTSTIMYFPFFIFMALSNRFPSLMNLANALGGSGGGAASAIFHLVQFVLIVFFTFFYTALLFNSDDLAEQLKKGGGFVPSVRPGKQTAKFFDYILTRIAFIGAMYLGLVALSPNFITYIFGLPFVIMGTSLLIVVGVALEFAAQLESYLIEHRYEGFLSTGRVKDRLMR